MIIKNNNGQFEVTATQFSFLIAKFQFNKIDSDIINKTNFMTTVSDYEKAHHYFDENIEEYRNKLDLDNIFVIKRR